MPNSDLPKCWFCGGSNVVDKGVWQLCSDCHASTVEIPTMAPPAMVVEPRPVAEQYSSGMDKPRGRPVKPRGRPSRREGYND